MDGASFENALNRIDAAIARIERAAARRADNPAQEINELQARHERLRGTVVQTLRQLDDLLAGQQP